MLTRLTSGSVTAFVFGLILLGTATSAVAEPTQVTKIRGKTLVVYEEATGTTAKRIPVKKISMPINIIAPPSNGRFKVVIDGDEWWILKAQAVTDEIVAGPAVNCQSITTSYASSRAFSDCKE